MKQNFTTISEVYKSLPPYLPVLKSEIFKDESNYNVSDPEYFQNLKEGVKKHIDQIEDILESKENENDKKDKERKEKKRDPAPVMLLQSLKYANDVIMEIDRSLIISQTKKKLLKRNKKAALL